MNCIGNETPPPLDMLEETIWSKRGAILPSSPKQTLPEPQADWALFLDFDGTLVEIAERPDGIALVTGLAELLRGLERTLNGALAVVSGRGIEELDAFLNRAIKVVAGHHGQELRLPGGGVEHHDVPSRALADMRRELDSFVQRHPGLLLEVKAGSLALHFRQRPDLEDECDRLARHLVAGYGGELAVLNGKMVREIKAAGPNKGDAVARLMELPPFAGRRPVYAGDDVTDEDAFAVVNSLNGISVKVGAGETCAAYRVSTVAALRRWLAQIEKLAVMEAVRDAR